MDKQKDKDALEISLAMQIDIAATRKVLDQLEHLEWLNKLGLRETSDMLFPAVRTACAKIGIGSI